MITLLGIFNIDNNNNMFNNNILYEEYNYKTIKKGVLKG